MSGIKRKMVAHDESEPKRNKQSDSENFVARQWQISFTNLVQNTMELRVINGISKMIYEYGYDPNGERMDCSICNVSQLILDVTFGCDVNDELQVYCEACYCGPQSDITDTEDNEEEKQD